jgi:hypothetical protein
LKGGCGDIGPDTKHPFIIRNMSVSDSSRPIGNAGRGSS